MRGRRFGAVGLVLAMGVAACVRPPGAVQVPTYPPRPPTTTASPVPASTFVECESLLPEAEVVAVLGFPLNGIVVHETRDVPAPQVGRLERQWCSYSSVDMRAPATGLVLVVTVGTFADPGAARAQYERNVADVAGTAAVVPTPLGAVTATTVPLPGRSELLAVYRTHTVDVAAVDRVGGRRGVRTAVVDIARRVLARLPGSTRKH